MSVAPRCGKGGSREATAGETGGPGSLNLGPRFFSLANSGSRVGRALPVSVAIVLAAVCCLFFQSASAAYELTRTQNTDESNADSVQSGKVTHYKVEMRGGRIGHAILRRQAPDPVSRHLRTVQELFLFRDADSPKGYRLWMLRSQVEHSRGYPAVQKGTFFVGSKAGRFDFRSSPGMNGQFRRLYLGHPMIAANQPIVLARSDSYSHFNRFMARCRELLVIEDQDLTLQRLDWYSKKPETREVRVTMDARNESVEIDGKPIVCTIFRVAGDQTPPILFSYNWAEEALVRVVVPDYQMSFIRCTESEALGDDREMTWEQARTKLDLFDGYGLDGPATRPSTKRPAKGKRSPMDIQNLLRVLHWGP